MRKIFFVFLTVAVFSVIEFVLFNVFGRWFLPNLMLLAVIFFNLLWGIRFSLLCAFIAGTVKGCFGVTPFGIHLIAFILCAYMTTFLKTYIYHVGSKPSRLLLIFVICVFYVICQTVLYFILTNNNWADIFRYVLLPQVFVTTLVASYVMERLKQCVLKSFVFLS